MLDDSVGGEPATLGAGILQRLADFCPSFMASEPARLRQRFPRLSLAAGEDAAGEAVAATVRLAAAGRLPEDTDLAAYLHTAAVNRVRTDFRRQARADKALAVKGADTPGTVAGSVASQDLLEELVVPAIKSMRRSRRRRVVELQSQGWTDEEIADELGIPLSRLYHDRHAALRSLRRILAGHIPPRVGKNNKHGKKGD
ncbi:RNA polymerase sigma factor [Streptomyces erythrochromogenes]|uniref:RNA polymerase sigma factor n=1 Tax=Streptomyces erythrochromogenes TaxID=285574 RepID=UPI0034194B69